MVNRLLSKASSCSFFISSSLQIYCSMLCSFCSTDWFSCLIFNDICSRSISSFCTLSSSEEFEIESSSFSRRSYAFLSTSCSRCYLLAIKVSSYSLRAVCASVLSLLNASFSPVSISIVFCNLMISF